MIRQSTFGLVTILVFASGILSHADFLNDIERLMKNPESRSHEPVIKDSQEGYDLHRDFFYYDDSLVEMSYKRRNFRRTTQLTLAGQLPDTTMRVVRSSSYPFAVGQKTMVSFGQMSDRWDAKHDAHGNLYVAVYHGFKSCFVVNKLRAQLVTRLVNELNDYMPVLDYTATEKVEDDKKAFVELFRSQIKTVIVQIFQEIDRNIREHQTDSDSSSASATVAIVTKQFVITANVGSGNVVAYDGTQRMRDLTSVSSFKTDLFGRKKDKFDGYNLEPMVHITPRFFKDQHDEDDDELYGLQFLVLKSPPVARLVSNEEVRQIVLGEMNNLGSHPRREQDMYSNSIRRLIDTSIHKLDWIQRMQEADHTIMLVGLETDYYNIH